MNARFVRIADIGATCSKRPLPPIPAIASPNSKHPIIRPPRDPARHRPEIRFAGIDAGVGPLAGALFPFDQRQAAADHPTDRSLSQECDWLWRHPVGKMTPPARR